MSGAGWYWLEHPTVRARVNRMASGDPAADVYDRFEQFLREEGVGRPLRRCASLGCGHGGLERDLVRRGLVDRIEGYDSDPAAILEASRLAGVAGMEGISYQVLDLEAASLPEAAFDAVFLHSAAHRVSKLERMFADIRHSLKPGGWVHLNEFVGASRFQWGDWQLWLINHFLDGLPDRLRQTPHGRKSGAARPEIAWMEAGSPHQAVRSQEIRDVLLREFEIVEERTLGGTLLHMALSDIAQNFDPANPEDADHLQRLFDAEDDVLASGRLASDFSVIIARPAKRGHVPAGNPIPPPVPFGISPTRSLNPSRNRASSAVDLTVSRADTMLAGDDDHYLLVGQSALGAMERAFGDANPASLLDLPCGFGRVTRAMRARFPHARITVSDLDRPGVDFTARQFGARGAYSVRDFRSLDLGETYEGIWVGSLITHLPPAQTMHFFTAMKRHLAPGGRLLMSVHGPGIVPRLRATGYGLPIGAAEAVIEEFERTGFGYRDYVSRDPVYGVALTNDHYGISLTDRRWIERALSRSGLRLLAYEERAWDGHHDIVVAGQDPGR